MWLFQRDDMEAIPGYLSLHQTADIMTLKWTPNQLMNGSVGDLDYERRCDIIRLQMGYDFGHCVSLQSVFLSHTKDISNTVRFLYTVSPA